VHMPLNCLMISVIGLITAGLSTSAYAADPSAIEVNIANLRSANGKVWVCIWKDGSTEGFPNCAKGKPAALLSAPASAPKVVFNGISAGAYAISFFHDEKDTGTPETNLLGMPKSGVGLSNNPDIGVTSPPTFAKARFVVPDTVRHTIAAKYLF
jgi:uncharacterized protein (DUF2141 family)